VVVVLWSAGQPQVVLRIGVPPSGPVVVVLWSAGQPQVVLRIGVPPSRPVVVVLWSAGQPQVVLRIGVPPSGAPARLAGGRPSVRFYYGSGTPYRIVPRKAPDAGWKAGRKGT
jgi:hypothetical protein